MKHTPDYDDKAAQFIREGIRYIADTFQGPAAHSAPEHDTSEYLKGVLSAYGDEVNAEEVSYRADANARAFSLPAVFMTFACVLFYLTSLFDNLAFPITAALASLFGLLWLGYGFVFGKRIGDFLLQKRKGTNLSAVRKASAKAEKRVIITANTDFSPEVRFSQALPAVFFTIFAAVYGLCVVLSVILYLSYLGTGAEGMTGSFKTLAVIQLFFILVYIPAFFFFSRRRRVRGAAHNLSGVYAVIGILKELSESGFRYKDTELVFLLTCGKNAGQRGAFAYLKEHSSELHETPTTVLTLESLCRTDCLAVVSRDECGLQRVPDDLNALLVLAAEHAGYSMKKAAPMRLGSSDAVPFAHAGLRAAAVRAVGEKSHQFYPNRSDSAKGANVECIEAAMRTMVEAVNLIGENHLN